MVSPWRRHSRAAVRTKQERQNGDSQVKVTLAAFFALIEQAKEIVHQMQAVFREDIYSTVLLQLERRGNLEDMFEEASDLWEAEQRSIEEERLVGKTFHCTLMNDLALYLKYALSLH